MANLAAVLVIFSFTVGNAIYSDLIRSDQSDQLMRRHNDAVQLGAGEEMVARPGQKEEPKETSAQIEEMLSAINGRSKMDDLCNYNYTHGTKGTNTCADAGEYIEEDIECKNVAMLACPEPPHSCLGDKFVLDDWWYDKRPKRCYISDETPPKWYYNPSGDTPKDIIGGTPVCREVRYKDGDEDANTCPEHYESIMNEYECRTAANCLNDRAYDEFRYLSEAEQNAAPKGCHKTAKDSDAKGDVRFNNMSAIPDHADPSAPKGQPICQKSA